MIMEENLNPVRYFISGWVFNEHTDLYMVKKNSGWYIHAGEMYLADSDLGIEAYKGKHPTFFYKNGTVFETKERALEVLNLAIEKYKKDEK